MEKTEGGGPGAKIEIGKTTAKTFEKLIPFIKFDFFIASKVIQKYI